MSKRKSYLLVAAIILLAALADNLSDNPQDHPKEPAHTCTDTTHATCDGQCQCDGMECTE